MPTVVAHVGDLHVNSSVALMPPIVTLDDGQRVRQSKTQRWLWKNWLNYWERTAEYKKELGARVVGIINGDWGDINRHSGFQLIEPENRDVVLQMMVDTVKPMREVCDYIIVCRGTEAHTGGVGWLENHAAKLIGAVKNKHDGTHSWHIWRGEVDGVRMTSSHHPGTNSMRGWTAGNEANRRAVMDVLAFSYEKWRPQLTLWGHYHHWANSGDTHPIQAVYNRCWQVKTAFEYRFGFANQEDRIGGMWVFCDKGQYEVKPQKYPLPRERPWKPTII